jgi:hypothetical protein
MSAALGLSASLGVNWAVVAERAVPLLAFVAAAIFVLRNRRKPRG